MVMLMLFLLENNMTTAEFFEPVIYQQNVKSKSKQQTLDILKAKDFFGLLCERGIRKKPTEHDNLKEFLQLSPSFPDLLVLKSIRKTLEQMAENDDFMEAIREDIMAANEGAGQDGDDMYANEADAYDRSEGEDEGRAPRGNNQITTQDKMISGGKDLRQSDGHGQQPHGVGHEMPDDRYDDDDYSA